MTITDPTAAIDSARYTDTELYIQPAEGVSIPVFNVQPFTAGVAPFQALASSAFFSPVWDQLFFLGFNASLGAGGGVAGQPGWMMGFENAFQDPSYGNQVVCEWYVQYISPDHTSVTNFRPFACTVARANNASHGAQVQVDIGSDGTGVFNVITGGPAVATFAPTGITFAQPLVVNGGAISANTVLFNATASFQGEAQFQQDGVLKWYLAGFHGDLNMYLWDNVNGRFQVKHTAGASSAAATTELQASLKVDGNIGFYATAPAAKQTVTGSKAANAALTSLMAALVAIGLVTDTTT